VRVKTWVERVAILVCGAALGAALVSPAAGHVTKSFPHLWESHIKPRAGREIVTKQITLLGQGVGGDTVQCPSGKLPVGGGADAEQDNGNHSTLQRIVESYPTGDGWAVSLRNDEAADRKARIYVICTAF
jgi:hypothetical protein